MTDITKIIVLGGKEFPIAPLTLGQMRSVAPSFTRIENETPQGVGAQITIMHAAISAHDATVTFESIENIRGVTFAEMKEAIEVIGELIGLKRLAKEPAPGEANAPAAAAPSEATATS